MGPGRPRRVRLLQQRWQRQRGTQRADAPSESWQLIRLAAGSVTGTHGTDSDRPGEEDAAETPARRLSPSAGLAISGDRGRAADHLRQAAAPAVYGPLE